MRNRITVFALLIAIEALAACGSDKAQAPVIVPAVRDTSPPSVSLAVRPLPIPRDSSFTVDGTVTGPSGVAAVTVNGVPAKIAQGSRAFSLTMRSAAAVDDVRLNVYVRDSAGNSANPQSVYPTRPQQLALTVAGIPRPDSIVDQLGLLVVVQGFTGYEAFTWTVDSVTAGWYLDKPPLVLTAPFLRPGTHTARLVVTPTTVAIAKFDTTFTFTTRVDSRPYQMTVLPALAGDVDAVGHDMNESGTVVGESRGVGAHAVRWQAGQVLALGDPIPHDTVSHGNSIDGSVAYGVNSSGEAVGLLRESGKDFAVLWAPGASMRIIATGTQGLRINAARQVLLGYEQTMSDVTLLDLPSGTSTVLWQSAFARGLNDRGQVVGNSSSFFESSSPLTFGVTLAPRPALPPFTSGHVFYEPFDINDTGDVLLWYSNGYSYPILSRGSNAILLSPYLGSPRESFRMNNRGVVAAVEPDSAIYTWNEMSRMGERVGTNPAWQFDGIARITDNGVILAHGRDIITGKRGPVLLSPVR